MESVRREEGRFPRGRVEDREGRTDIEINGEKKPQKTFYEETENSSREGVTRTGRPWVTSRLSGGTTDRGGRIVGESSTTETLRRDEVVAGTGRGKEGFLK